MKLLQLLENTAPQFPTSKEAAEKLLKKYRIENYTINDDLTVDVDGDVNLYNRKLKNLPIKFGLVTGDFYCNSNLLTTLDGAPKETGGSFYCHINKLDSLRGSPKVVGGDFYCMENNLKDLRGGPREVVGLFTCGGNEHLVSLTGAPKEHYGDFACRRCPNLKSLRGIGNTRGQIISDI